MIGTPLVGGVGVPAAAIESRRYAKDDNRVLRYGVTLLAFLVVAGIALHQNGPAPPSGVPDPVQLSGESGVAGAHGKRRARPRHRGAVPPGQIAGRRPRGREVRHRPGTDPGAGSVVVNNDDATPARAPAVDDRVGDDESGSPTADD